MPAHVCGARARRLLQVGSGRPTLSERATAPGPPAQDRPSVCLGLRAPPWTTLSPWRTKRKEPRACRRAAPARLGAHNHVGSTSTRTGFAGPGPAHACGARARGLLQAGSGRATLSDRPSVCLGLRAPPWTTLPTAQTATIACTRRARETLTHPSVRSVPLSVWPGSTRAILVARESKPAPARFRA